MDATIDRLRVKAKELAGHTGAITTTTTTTTINSYSKKEGSADTSQSCRSKIQCVLTMQLPDRWAASLRRWYLPRMQEVYDSTVRVSKGR
jgi:hypothetical protein